MMDANFCFELAFHVSFCVVNVAVVVVVVCTKKARGKRWRGWGVLLFGTVGDGIQHEKA